MRNEVKINLHLVLKNSESIAGYTGIADRLSHV